MFSFVNRCLLSNTSDAMTIIMVESIPDRPFGIKVNNPNLPATVPIIGMGCSSFANNFLPDEAELDKKLSCNQDTAHLLPSDHEKVKGWIATLKYAVEHGINLLDTAPWYGHGSSEVVIGLALKQAKIDRHKIIINTKIGRYDSDPLKQFDFSYDMTIKSTKRSIERMGCQYIDVLQLHDPEFSPSIDLLLEETIPAMLECKRRGWVKALGLTGYPLEIHYEILQRVSEIPNNGEAVFDQTLTYGHFNLHNQNLCSLAVEKDWSLMEYCQSKAIALMAAAPLSMGLLTHDLPPFWHPAPNSLKQACRDAADVAKGHGVDLPTLAVLFALAHDNIGCTLIGMGCQRDVDCALSAVRRYEKATEAQITSLGVADNGKELRTQIETKLAAVLNASELQVLAILMDESGGPFATVWKNGEHVWDGKKAADEFWSTVEGGKVAAEARMRVRS